MPSRTSRLAVLLTAVALLVVSTGCIGSLGMLGGGHMWSAAPVARIVASTTSGTAPLAVDFDFSQSHCNAGIHTAHHRFDPGLGTMYDVVGGMHYVYMVPGTYRAQLRIVDADGRTSEAETVITVL